LLPNGGRDIIARMASPKLDVAALTPEERLDLIERLWDSLDSAHVGLTPTQQAEVERRLDDMDAHPEDVVSLPDALRRIRERKR
jgi:putative addiction module component (TIGR02574 family)